METTTFNPADEHYMRQALALARRGYGKTSPNPMVGAVLVRGGQIIGRGWHHRAGLPHAEIEALADARANGRSVKGAILYVTLEPCSTRGRTPACTEALISAGIAKVIIASVDPNPAHSGRALKLLPRAGIDVAKGLLIEEATRLNEAFNHWIVHRTPFVTVKSAMTLDGKIATKTGESKWITSEQARAVGMKLRLGSDAILVGIGTVLRDDPSLTIRSPRPGHVANRPKPQHRPGGKPGLRRIILDTEARTPLTAKVVSDNRPDLTTVVVGSNAPPRRVAALAKRVTVVRAPARHGHIDLAWLLHHLGKEEVTALLVEGGSTVNTSFLAHGLTQRVAFFYAPRIIGGRTAVKTIAGRGAARLDEAISLQDVVWRKVGPDLLLTARVKPTGALSWAGV